MKRTKSAVLSIILAFFMILQSGIPVFANETDVEKELNSILREIVSYVTYSNMESYSEEEIAVYEEMMVEENLGDTIQKKTKEKLNYSPNENSFYVSLGDSTVTGMGLEGYGNHGYKVKVPEAYPYRIAEAMGLDPETQYEQLACGGFRPEEILALLDENFEADDYFYGTGADKINGYAGGEDSARKDFHDNLAKADLVSVGAGGNCFGTYQSFLKNQYMLTGIMPEIDWGRYFNEAEVKALKGRFSSIRSLLALNGSTEAEIDEFMLNIESVIYGYFNLMFNYNRMLDTILEYAPNASMIIVGLYNIIRDVYMDIGGVRFELGGFYNEILNILNRRFQVYAATKDNVIFVDAPDVESFNYEAAKAHNIEFSYESYNAFIKSEYGPDNDHATAKGHAYIADQIMKCINLTENSSEEENQTQVEANENIKYLSLGDSMADGVSSYINTFVSWLEDVTGRQVDHSSFVKAGMTAETLREKLTGDYHDVVAEADLISLGIGNDSFGLFLYERILEATGVKGTPEDVMAYDVDQVIAGCTPELQEMFHTIINRLYGIVETVLEEPLKDGDDSITTEAEAIANAVTYTTVRYMIDYVAVINKILVFNPDADIIQVALMNPYTDAVSADHKLEKIANYSIELVNLYLAAIPTVMGYTGDSPYDTAVFYYAEADDIEVQGGAFDYSVLARPTENGHAAIFQAMKTSYVNRYKAQTEIAKKIVTFAETIAVYGAESGKTKASNYVSIGDASVTGYGKTTVKSFSDQLAETLSLNQEHYFQLGVNGAATKELFDVVEKNADKIAGADLITFGVSTNAMLDIAYKDAIEVFLGGAEKVYDWEKYTKDKTEDVKQILADVKVSVEEMGMGTYSPMIMTLIESLAYQFVEFLYTYPELINEIRGLNSDAQIVLVGMYNPMEGLYVEGMDIGGYVEYITALANAHFTAYAVVTPNVVMAHAPEVETNAPAAEYTGIGFALALVRGIIVKNQYPTLQGHAYIKDQILERIQIVDDYGDVNRDGKVNIYDAILVLKYYAKLVSEKALDLSVADVNGSNKIDIYDAIMILKYYAKMIIGFPAAVN